MIRCIHNNRGFTLIELVMVIIIIGILATMATVNFSSSMETAKDEATMAEMESLARAIVGNPEVYGRGARSDFGYVGDIGAMPPNLDALVSNPGYSTWDGPYIKADFDSDDFKKDGWNTLYIYSDTLISSIGSGSNLDKVIVSKTSMLLSNSLTGNISDANGGRPSSDYTDSLSLNLAYPDGAGAMTTSTVHPNTKGRFSFSGIPIGNHTLAVIYIPDADTMTYNVSINPNHNTILDIVFPADLW